MRIRLPNGRFLFLRVETFGRKDMMPGIHSGPPFRPPQYLFLDYDNKDLSLVENDMQRIVTGNGLRRGIVVESSPGKYWGLSFSYLQPHDMADIHSKSQEDLNHTKHVLAKGYSVLRMGVKDGFVPHIVKQIINVGGDKFYNYDFERWFMSQFEKRKPFVADIRKAS
jgi:hypothetical protein